MAKTTISTKRVAISKANAQMVAIVGAASFFTIFALFASQAIFSTNKYQAKVIKQKEVANKQLDTDIKSFSNLQRSYAKFDEKTTNVIGGQKDGTGDKDGNNAKLVLDALPNSYDFPALASSLEKILNDRHLKIASINGTDDQVGQQANVASATPKTVEMPFSFSVSDANYPAVQDLLNTLQQSIRPIQIDKVTMSGDSSKMSVTINAHTYYQPAINLNISKKVVK